MTIQATIQNVNAEKYANLWITVPPIPEQQAILAVVERDTNVLDRLISRAQREIALIREYSTRLIADVVTASWMFVALLHRPANTLTGETEESLIIFYVY